MKHRSACNTKTKQTARAAPQQQVNDAFERNSARSMLHLIRESHRRVSGSVLSFLTKRWVFVLEATVQRSTDGTPPVSSHEEYDNSRC